MGCVLELPRIPEAYERGNRYLMRFGSLAVFALIFFVTACASGGASGDSGPRRNRNVISAEEIAELVGDYSAYDAVRRLRANWLTGRSGSPVRAFIDGVAMGDANILRNYRLEAIREFRFVSPSDATTRYGTGFGGGAIEVTTR